MTDHLSTGSLPEDYAELAVTVRDFAQRVVAPVAAKHDEEHSFPYEVVAGMAEMGLFGLPFPEEYGGMGGDYFALCLALEELGKVDQSVAITLEAGVSLGAMPVYRFGNDAQKQEWLPLLASGKALGAFGLTEAGGGKQYSVATDSYGDFWFKDLKDGKFSLEIKADGKVKVFDGLDTTAADINLGDIPLT